MQILKSLFLLLFISDLFAHTTYSQSIKTKKIYPLGKRVYEKRCSNIDVTKYVSYDGLLEAIEKEPKCSKLKKEYKEALGLYLWDEVRVKKELKKYPSLAVSHKEKCPICGMFLYKYPRWVSMIEYKDGKKIYFDGLKDLLKYYFLHPLAIKGLYTKDYYTQKTISLKDAYFVIGSDVYGPMGNELIAFSDKKSAKTFMYDHRGKKILKFCDINEKMVYKLDE